MYSLRHAALFAGARLDLTVRTRAERMSRRAVVGAAFVTAAIAAIAYLLGADVGGGLAGSQPMLLSQLLTPVNASAPQDAPPTHPSA
jgi:hypothetical protein